MSTGSLSWYVARAGGLVTWYLLAASLVWGLLLSTKLLGRFGNRRWLLDLHRFLGGLSVVFVGVHLVGILLDTYVEFGFTEVLVPFTSSWRPGAVAWGIVAFYVLLAVEITSLIRSRLPRRVWHAVHLGSFGLFLFATVHLLTAGTDASQPLVRLSMAVVVGAVVFLAAYRGFLRVIARPEGPRPPRAVRPSPTTGPSAPSAPMSPPVDPWPAPAPVPVDRPWAHVPPAAPPLRQPVGAVGAREVNGS